MCKNIYKYLAVFFITAPCFLFSVDAQEKTDHPLLSGLSGFEITKKTVAQFDGLELKDHQVKGKIPGQVFPWRAEGKITKISYEAKNETRSNLQIYQNYETALKKLGAVQLNVDFERTSMGVSSNNHIFKLPSANGAEPAYILVYPNNPTDYYLTFIEPVKMEQEVVGGKLADEIKTKGFATLYINFDINKSDLKSDGLFAVKQITELLKSDRSLKLAIKGHTDNIGMAAANKKLSQDRASSVMAAVLANGIDANRLSAVGMGAEVPMADNQSEAGRAKNRRVELFKIN